MRRIEAFNDEVVLTALMDYLISRPNTPFNINALPNMSDRTLFKICDSILSEVCVPKHKFDAVVQIMLKKKEVERLMNLANNACYDHYNIETPSQQKGVGLTMKDKLDLVHTA